MKLSRINKPIRYWPSFQICDAVPGYTRDIGWALNSLAVWDRLFGSWLAIVEVGGLATVSEVLQAAEYSSTQ